MSYIKPNFLDSMSQHAYRIGPSCLTAWMELNTFIQCHRNDVKVFVIAISDQSAAFNELPKDVLLSKLKLKYCVQSMELFMSSMISLSSGVVEGSVLGPYLYTLEQICISVLLDIVW